MGSSETMKPTQNLPENYVVAATLDLSQSRALLLILNLAGLVVLIFSGWLFWKAILWLRPQDLAGMSLEVNGLLDMVKVLVTALALTAFMVLLHEGVHGLFFWLFSGARPVFAFRGAYAYAALPGWFIPRKQYLVIGLSPLVIISLLGVALLAVAPPAWFLSIWFVLSFNAGGAVGDLLVMAMLLRQPADCLAYDYGDAFALYAPKKDAS
jgi:hypothetical protein